MVAADTAARHLVAPGGRPVRVAPDPSRVVAGFRRRYADLLSRYDAAQTNSENTRHWSMADGLSAEAAANPEVRYRLRTRSRYEVQENNCHGKGILLKHAATMIGRCPRPQVEVEDGGEAGERWADLVERHWERWSRAVNLGRKLRTMAMAKTCDGEAFAILVDNPRVEHQVKLDLRLVEADQVTTPNLPVQADYIDGIRFDRNGNPLWYDVLPEHPGSTNAVLRRLQLIEPQRVPAGEMLHWFREDRPGMRRGIPETTPALPLFAQLRRFTLATIAAAETAADHAAVIRTNVHNLESGPAEVEALDAIDIEMRSMLTLPEGWDISQLKAEHPQTTFEMFERAILKQMAQCVIMPYNMAAGDSSNHNMASGRLDHKMYDQYIGIERHDLGGAGLLHRVFAAWYREFRLVAAETGRWQGEAPALDAVDVSWFFDAADHAVDPNREASGENTRLSNGSLTFAELLGGRGVDWRKSFAQTARELGVSFEELQELIRNKLFGAPGGDEQGGEPDSPSAETGRRETQEAAT